jgi:hypothetical protein
MDKFSVFLYCGVIGTMLYKSLTSNGRGSGDKKDGNGKAKSRQWHMAAWAALSFVVSDLTLVSSDRLSCLVSTLSHVTVSRSYRLSANSTLPRWQA